MRTLTLTDIADAPLRSFGAASAIAQDLSDWYAKSDGTVAGFHLGEKEDSERDGSDAQLRDAICTLAGMKREREAVLNEDGTQAVSEKRGKPIYKETPFSTRDRLAAMHTLGLSERERWRKGTSRGVAIVRHDGTVSEDEGTEDA